MRARLTGASVAVTLALLAGFAPAAGAQTTPLPTETPTASPTPSPTATPTPTPTPTPEEQAEAERDERDRKAEGVRRVYRDFERDGFIDDCDHTARALKRARRSIEDSYAEDHPDFRDALTAALERHRAGQCEEQEVAPEEEESPADTGGGTGDTGGSGGGTSPGTLDTTTPPPPPPVAPPAPEQGTLPDFGGDNPTAPPGDSGGGEVAPLPDEGAIPEGTPSPEATPVPTQAPPVEPKLIVSQSSADPNMFVPGAMLAVALLGLMIAALTALLGRRSERFAGVAQAWREAAWRTSGTWSDFTDWLRAGR